MLACERIMKKKKDVVITATKALNNHLRIRKAFDLVCLYLIQIFQILSDR